MLANNNLIIPMLMYTHVRGDPLYKWNPARKLRTLILSLLFSLKKYKARAKIKKFFPGTHITGRCQQTNLIWSSINTVIVSKENLSNNAELHRNLGKIGRKFKWSPSLVKAFWTLFCSSGLSLVLSLDFCGASISPQCFKESDWKVGWLWSN